MMTIGAVKKAKSEYRQLLKWLKDYKRLLERPTGEWISTTFLGERSLECNQCGKVDFGVKYYHFCPNCGARMI